MLRVIALALVVIGIASCATMVSFETANDSLNRASNCCATKAQFNYTPLAIEGPVSINLDASATAFNFETGKSYFKAFRLPEKSLPYRLTITSYALGDVIRRGHIFYPQVALLNDQFAMVWKSMPEDFIFSKASSKIGGLPIKLEATLLVDKPDAIYMLVYTTQALMRSTSPYDTIKLAPVILPGFVTAIPTGEETVQIRHSAFGMLFIEETRAE